jgi:CIC family chloride channel protein
MPDISGKKHEPRRALRLQWLRRAWEAWLDRARMHERIFDLCVAILIGVACGFGAVAFRHLIDGCHFLFWGASHPTLEGLKAAAWWRRLLMPALGGLAVGPIIYYFAKEAKGHGVPEVMLAVAVRKGVIRARVAIAKAVASALTIASGGSAGREGPVIQIGSAIGSWVGQVLHVSSRRLRTYVGCGAAAGIAATFNAPIAGALFAVEIILGEFGVAQFSPIVISSVLATVIARHMFGGGPVFEVPAYELASIAELGPYLVLGLVCGVVSVVFIRVLYFAEDRFDGLSRVHELARPLLGGLLLGLIGLWFPHVYGDGYASINMALNNSHLPALLLVALLLAKVLATSLTLGSGGSGGVFAPSLFLGAMVGGAFGQGVGLVFGQSAGAAGGYALVAMGGVVAGTTLAPITAILIIFEITYDYGIILPLMTVCIISSVVTGALNKESIYTMKLVRRGVDLFRGRSLDVLKSFNVRDAMARDFDTFPPETSVGVLMDEMISSDHNQFYITTGEGALFGLVSIGDLRRILMHREGLEQVLLAEDLAHEQVPVCYPDESLSQALVKFEHSGFSELPVVEREPYRKLVGVLRYTEVFATYNRQVLDMDAAEGLARRVHAPIGSRKVELVKGFSMVEWDPPSHLWGKTLLEAALPSRYGVRVVIVKKRPAGGADESVIPIVPGADYVLTEEDCLVIYGKDEDLERAMRQ